MKLQRPNPSHVSRQNHSLGPLHAIALLTMVVATTVGVMAALGLSKVKFRGKGLMEGYFLLPLIVPGIVLAVGLSMDAFAVSICKGLALQRVSWKECCIAGAWFGGFQALMPLLGYLLGTQFEQFVTSVDHWIAFVLLGIIGGNMIREALSKDEDKLDGSLAFKTMLLLAIATSIDALAVGITFAFLPGTRIVPAVALIGSITFVFSAAGIRLGNVFGLRYKRKAEFAGGVILILLGTKILLEHLGVL